MTEENTVEEALSRIGQRLVQIEQTIQENLRHCLENQVHSHQQVTSLRLDICLEVLRQEIDRVLGQEESNS